MHAYNEKLLHILSQGKPNMTPRYFNFIVDHILGISGMPEYEVSIMYGRAKRVVAREVFISEKAAKMWGVEKIKVLNKGL